LRHSQGTSCVVGWADTHERSQRRRIRIARENLVERPAFFPPRPSSVVCGNPSVAYHVPDDAMIGVGNNLFASLIEIERISGIECSVIRGRESPLPEFCGLLLRSVQYNMCIPRFAVAWRPGGGWK
jgi:hypothetical protein